MIDLYSKIKKYKAIFIDIDNTLYNYDYAHSIALNTVLRKYSFTLNDYNRAKDIIKSRNLKANCHKKDIYFKVLTEITNRSFYLAKDMYEDYSKVFYNNMLINKDIKNAIIRFHNENKKVVALTNYYTIPQINKLEKCGLLYYIDYLITSEEFEEEKPSCTLVNRALELSGVSKDEVISIGDSVTDIFDDIDYYPFNCNKMFISISGRSGAGKTTIAKAIEEVISCKVISADGYHKYERNSEVWKRLTHYDPSTNNLVQMAMDIHNLYYDFGADIPIYDHSTGTFGESENIKSTNSIIIEGLHTLYPEITGDYIPIKIFVDSDMSDKQKIERDSTNRHEDLSQVYDSINRREPDYIKYIAKQKEYSNFIIEVRNGKYSITIKDLNIKDHYEGDYSNLLDTIKSIFKEMFNNIYE